MSKLKERILLEWFCEWVQLFQIGRCAWYDITIANIYFEIDRMAKAFEMKCVLLGLGFRLRIDDFEHSQLKPITDKAWEQIKAGQVENGGFAIEEQEHE